MPRRNPSSMPRPQMWKDAMIFIDRLPGIRNCSSVGAVRWSNIVLAWQSLGVTLGELDSRWMLLETGYLALELPLERSTTVLVLGPALAMHMTIHLDRVMILYRGMEVYLVLDLCLCLAIDPLPCRSTTLDMPPFLSMDRRSSRGRNKGHSRGRNKGHCLGHTNHMAQDIQEVWALGSACIHRKEERLQVGGPGWAGMTQGQTKVLSSIQGQHNGEQVLKGGMAKGKGKDKGKGQGKDGINRRKVASVGCSFHLHSLEASKPKLQANRLMSPAWTPCPDCDRSPCS